MADGAREGTWFTGRVVDDGPAATADELRRRRRSTRQQPRRPASTTQEAAVSISVLDMSVSLDGYIADPDDFLGGDDGERLHKWADVDGASGRLSEVAARFQDEWTAAGAVLAGRRTAELMD